MVCCKEFKIQIIIFGVHVGKHRPITTSNNKIIPNHFNLKKKKNSINGCVIHLKNEHNILMQK